MTAVGCLGRYFGCSGGRRRSRDPANLSGVILFKPENVALVLSGRKTQTRRRWKRRRMLPGSIHQAKTRLFGEPFASIRVQRVWREPLGTISDADAIAEGYPGREEFAVAFARINGDVPPDEVVWCVEFALMPVGE